MRKYVYLFKLIKALIKECIGGKYTKDSIAVKSYGLLILSGKITIEEVPDIGKLREATISFLTD